MSAAVVKRYCDFFSGSCCAPEDEVAPLLGELAPLPEVLGEALLPPEAEPAAEPEPDFAGSEALGVELEELDELGEVAELPPEGELDEELAPELDGGVEGDVALPLALPLPLLAPLDLLPPLSWPQAARPKAMATATASVESFMCPPWLG